MGAPAVTVRAAAVAWREHAVLLPGPVGTGKSTLCEALVRAGATPLADGRVRLEEDGRVRGHEAGDPDRDALPVALVVATAFTPGGDWRPEERRGPRAALPVLENVIGPDVRRQRLLRIAARMTPSLSTLCGPRAEADVAAPRILAYVDAMLDGDRASCERLVSADGVSFGAEAEKRQLVGRFVLQLYWHGRFGNRMHQYAYGVTYARLAGCRFLVPSEWEGTHLFAEAHHEVLARGGLRAELNRCTGLADDPERRVAAIRARVPDVVRLRPRNPQQNYRRYDTPVCFDDVCAYHPSIFTAMSLAHLRSVFAFSERVKALDLYKRLEDRQGTYDIAHLRRDDISNPKYNRTHVQGYSVVSKESYEKAFRAFGFDPASMEWVSDDYTGRWHEGRVTRPRGRWWYPAGAEVLPDVLFDWLEDFLRLYFARTIFRANSSFSWWAACLSPHARVFSPVMDKKHVYGVDGMDEIDVEFVEGNRPHWMFGNEDIVLGP
jgi:hypothetical protein